MHIIMVGSIQVIFVLMQMTILVSEGKSSHFTRRLPTDPNNTTRNVTLVTPNVPSMPDCAILCHRADCESFEFDSDESSCRFLTFTSEPADMYFINTNIESCHTLPAGQPSGVYNIRLTQHIDKRVFCDMDTDDGGWTVLQNRFDGSQNFNLAWEDYKNGFGTPSGEHWIGNDVIHLLTSSQSHMLRIEISQISGEHEVLEYSTFNVSSEEDNYRLEISGYSGNLYDAFRNHNGHQFSTPDRDNDVRGPVHCAGNFRGGWWFSACFEAYFNGVYGAGYITTSILWRYYPSSDRIGLKTSRMMIRPQ
ncbi:ryncolin-1-like [Argopecten irradians]|uniref:ryncolin-1-like n=1 Tax=Argopecten irradians TaxID=31199 RepID=UPI00371BDF20